MREQITASDRGFTLVELAIYVVLLGFIAIIVASTVPALFRSEATVSGLTESQSSSQAVEMNLRKDIGNAREVRVTNNGRTLTASVAGADTQLSWKCVRWSFDQQAGNTLGLVRSEAPDSANPNLAGGAVLLPTSKQLVLSPIGTDPFFTANTAAGVAGTVTYAWQLSGERNAKHEIRGEYTTRAQGSAVSSGSQCFS